MKTDVKKPAKRRLSRDVVANAGLELVKRDGFDHLTMKALAVQLGVTPMAIYRHVSNKSDLIDVVLDAFVRDANVCSHDSPEAEWDAWLRATYTNMYEALKNMTSLHPYLGNAPRFGPHAMDVMAQILSVLRAAGFTQQQSVNAMSILTGFMIGCAMMDSVFHQALLNANQNNKTYSSLDVGLDHIFVSLKAELSWD